MAIDFIKDPNQISIGSGIKNAIPAYQNMYIFAELEVFGKSRSIIITSNGTNSENNIINDTYSKISLLGYAQENDSNYGNYTTNYYYGSVTDGKKQYEGFGIDSIKIVVNSSYVPQVNIRFVDIRGQAFLNLGEKSPYSVLFDFPPPTYKLTVKGYYGKPVTYLLHMVKHSVEFNSENGNYIIDADFIGLTFAPLSDVLFRYVVNFNLPPINNDIQISLNSNKAPQNTYELILKLKNFYSRISEYKSNSNVVSLENTKKIKGKIRDIIDIINNYKNNDILKVYKPYLIISEKLSTIFDEIGGNNNIVDIQYIKTSDGTNYVEATNNGQRVERTVTKINNLSDYNKIISYIGSSDSVDNISKRLSIAFISSNNEITLTNVLKKYNNQTLLDKIDPSLNINPNTNLIGKFIGDNNIETNTKIATEYVYLDISELYINLYKKIIDTNNKETELVDVVSNEISSIINNDLGFIPTIRNIFEIILNDVDNFFDVLRKTSIDAENIHNNSDQINIITNNFSNDVYNQKHVYAFPLIIEKKENVEEKVAPIKLVSNGAKFPELDLVKNFIDTFKYQSNYEKVYNLRNEQNDDGSYRWYPISPIDSVIGGASYVSPYYTNNILQNNDNFIIDVFYKILVKRFYALSEGILNNYFFSNNSRFANDYIKLYSEIEAINIFETIKNDIKLIDVFKNEATKYANSTDFVYKKITTLNDNGINLYSFDDNQIKSFNIDDNTSIYLDKNDDNFIGLKIDDKQVNIKNETGGGNDVFENFVNETKTKWFSGVGVGSEYYKFTQENNIYIPDITSDNTYNTRYLSKKSILGLNYSDDNDYNGLNKYGNKRISNYSEINIYNVKRRFKHQESMSKIWVDVLEKNDDNLYDVIINNNGNLYDTLISTVVLLSNFGSTLSPFENSSEVGLNTLLFKQPAIIQTPKFLTTYIGSLVAILEVGKDKVDKLFNYITSNSNVFVNRGYRIIADLYDVKNYLSVSDKKVFLNEYNTFISSDFNTIKSVLLNAYNSANNSDDDKGDVYEEQLKPIFEILNKKTNIINYTRLTFSYPNINNNNTNPDIYYKSISKLIENTNNNNRNNKTNIENYFKNFFNRLRNELVKIQSQVKEKSDVENKKYEDFDIITQTYYSFKNINDKWLTTSNSVKGYPFNRENGKLKDLFVFVDRAMNPVDDTIINVEYLLNVFDDPNVSVYSVLSGLLSANGFEFFPLQNFLVLGNDWEDTFKIYNGYVDTQISTAFICMYIGGNSKYPTITNSGFKPDGFSFETPPPDFNSNQNIVQNNNNFPYSKVHAFRVKFGEQNQSMFVNIKIDSKEYGDTNESIQILSRLANDTKGNAPIPKGQNLYNVYENRSYKATVTSLGNMMIQPTQYFQLDNIPLYNGAYIILNVEHNITPNKMLTTFSGTKIPQYPIPRVTNPIAFGGLINILNLDDSVDLNTVDYNYDNVDDNAYNMLKLK